MGQHFVPTTNSPLPSAIKMDACYALFLAPKSASLNRDNVPVLATGHYDPDRFPFKSQSVFNFFGTSALLPSSSRVAANMREPLLKCELKFSRTIVLRSLHHTYKGTGEFLLARELPEKR